MGTHKTAYRKKKTKTRENISDVKGDDGSMRTHVNRVGEHRRAAVDDRVELPHGVGVEAHDVVVLDDVALVAIARDRHEVY